MGEVSIRSTVERCTSFPSYWRAVATTAFQVGCRKRMAIGFGCSRNMDRAKKSALGELHERLWTLVALEAPEEALSLETLDGHAVGSISTRAALGLHPPEAELFVSSDATGLAFHWERASAVRHGLREIFERYTTHRIWSGDEEVDRCCMLGTLTPAPGVMVHLFSLGGLPYCLAMCVSAGYLSFGAKADRSLRQAIVGAISEAIVIHDTYHPGRNAARPVYPSRHMAKMSLLETEQGRRKVVQHMLSRCSRQANRFDRQSKNATTFMKQYGMPCDKFRVVVFKSKVGCCVRVIPTRPLLTELDSSQFQLPML